MFALFAVCLCLLLCESIYSLSERNFTGDNGTIVPELQDGRYLSNINEIYNVKGPSGNRVKLTFISFDVVGTMPSCTEDSLEVFVGCQEKSIGKFCSLGGFKPFDIYSMDECVSLVFKTDDSMDNSTGFEIHYTVFPKNESVNNNTKCSNLNQQTSGNFLTPLWPNMYPSKFSCIWKLTIPDGYRSRIYFFNFRIEDNLNCHQDILVDDHVVITAYNASANLNVTIRKRLCSSYSDKTFVVDVDDYPVVFVTFHSDDDTSRVDSETGFAAGFMAYKPGPTVPASNGSSLDGPTISNGSSIDGPTTGNGSSVDGPTSGTREVISTNTSVMIVMCVLLYSIFNK